MIDLIKIQNYSSKNDINSVKPRYRHEEICAIQIFKMCLYPKTTMNSKNQLKNSL